MMIVASGALTECGPPTNQNTDGGTSSPYPNNPHCARLEMGQQQVPMTLYGAACAFNAAPGDTCSFARGVVGMGRCVAVTSINRPGLDDYARTNRVPLWCVPVSAAVPFACYDAQFGSYQCPDGSICWRGDDAGMNGVCVPLPCN